MQSSDGSARARRPRRPPGVDIRPGTVKQARQEAGLTLAQVAGNELSRTAIHLIENGRSRPSEKTLQLIAARTGKPVSYFSAAQTQDSRRAELEELESLVLHEDFAAATGLAERLIATSTSTSARAEASYWLGRASYRLSRSDEAEQALRSAVDLFAELGDRWMAVEAKHYLGKSLFLRENPGALAFSLAALAECRQLEPVPALTEAGLLEGIAAIHLARHEWSEAIAASEEALAAASGMREMGRVSQLYDNLGMAYEHLGQLDTAARYTHKALALTRFERDQSSVARIQNNLALVLLRQGQLDSAEAHLLEALRICEELKLDRGRSHVFLSLGELYLARGDRAIADGFFQQGADLAHSLGERMTEGLAHQFLGRSADLDTDHRQADREFAIALALLEKAQAPERLLSCRIEYARLLRRRGETEAALEQWEKLADHLRPGAEEGPAMPYVMVG